MLALLTAARGFGPRRILRPRGFGHRGLFWAAGGHAWIVLVVIAVVVIAFVVHQRRHR